MKKKVLIVEDDDFFRNTICDLLSEKFKVLQAPNGKSACEILSLESIDLVITDIQMPQLSGIELLERSKKNKPTPFIIMTGFSTILETKSAFELGAQGFISKPFKTKELFDCVYKIIDTEAVQSEPEKSTRNFCKVSVDDFVSKPLIDFDVYIKLSETNFIKIANKNEQLPRHQIEQYKTKGVKHLYILKTDFSKLVHFNLDLAKVLNKSNSISPDKKISFIKYTGEVILEKTFVDGLNPEAVEDASAFVKLSVETITDSKDSFDLLKILSQHSDATYSHSIAVSMYSVLIAKELGFESTQTLYKLSMASLFHDIGKKEIDAELLKKPRHLISKEERKEIESHVIRTQEILSSMKSIPHDVTRVASEHHEDQEGHGYPFRKSKREQHPLSRIVQCANIFIDNINMNLQDNNKVSAIEVIEHIEKIYENRVDTDCIKALKKMFNNS